MRKNDELRSKSAQELEKELLELRAPSIERPLSRSKRAIVALM